MDEPFAALDALTREVLHVELQTLWSATRKTIVFVTHNVREALVLGDRVLVLSARPGRIKREFRCDLPRPAVDGKPHAGRPGAGRHAVTCAARSRPLRRMSAVTGWRLKLIFFVGLLLLWEVLVRLQLWPPYVFPSPLAVGRSLFDGIANGVIPLAVLTSLRRLLLAYALSLLIGIPLGLLLGRTRLLQETLGTLVLGLQALPSICWLPLALLWFGLSRRAIAFVVVMGAVLSITLSTADGVRNTPPLYLRAARTLGARGWRLYCRRDPAGGAARHRHGHEAGLVVRLALADGRPSCSTSASGWARS